MKHDGCPCCRAIFIDEATLLEDEKYKRNADEIV
jgi:hypothetical protein